MGLTIQRKTIPLIRWEGCYEQRWTGRIVEEAFAHPAKASRALIVRIYNHLLDHGLSRGDTVLDPFLGIGTTAIEGANRGLQVIGIELEPKFVALAQANVEKHRRYWTGMGYPIPVIVQGDSRWLREVLSGADAVIASLPYVDSVRGEQRKQEGPNGRPGQNQGASQPLDTYGRTPGQLGRLPEGDIVAVISSPPYAERDLGGDGQRKFGGNKTAQENAAVREGKGFHGTYGRTEGQLGDFPPGDIAAVIGGPPCEDSPIGRTGGDFLYQGDKGYRRPGIAYDKGGYGRAEGQMGDLPGDTFWSAAQQVVRECYTVLKPGGVAVWVVKAFVRDKHLVDFPGDWRRLCESVGFETQEEIHALFVKERMVNGQVKVVERKSFFRRLAEKKGSPRIDWETIWVMQKPLARRQGELRWR